MLKNRKNKHTKTLLNDKMILNLKILDSSTFLGFKVRFSDAIGLDRYFLINKFTYLIISFNEQSNQVWALFTCLLL